MPRKEKNTTVAANIDQEHASTPDSRLPEPEEESFAHDTPGIIILHPGSSTLRLSLSNQLDPFYIPHLIAYRKIQSDNSPLSSINLVSDGVKILKRKNVISEELGSQRDIALENITESVTDSRAMNNVFDAESDITQYSLLNSKSILKPCVPDDEVSFQFTDLGTNPQFIIGNEVLNLPPNAPYQIFKPLRYGKINSDCGQSRSAVLKQLEDLWCRAIEECLDIPRRDFQFYRVIVLAPDIIDRLLYRDFMNIILQQLEFEAAFIHQESVCATYGAGLSTACVVDVGEEKTHICCVEDGMSNPNTRITLDYGGNDITRFLYWLLKKVKFPYKDCAEDDFMDGHLLQNLKERYCHFDMTVWGVAEEEIIVPYKGVGGLKFRIHFADELVYVPMSIYYAGCFCLSEDKDNVLMSGQDNQPAMLEDIYDESHWTTEQSQDKKGSGPSNTPKNGGGADRSSSNCASTDSVSEAVKRIQSIDKGTTILGLDQAIHFCIDCASSPEMKKKLYGSVLLIGGGVSFSQSAATLQSRLESSLPVQFSKGSDTVEVSSNPRDLNPKMISWRGGAVLAMLDSCQELWIENQEWELFGVRLLRERAPFVW